jgi:hypothetical protein
MSRKSKYDRYVHEEDGKWFVGEWSDKAAQWQRPLDASTRKLTGCFAEFSRKPFRDGLTRRQALRRARTLYG